MLNPTYGLLDLRFTDTQLTRAVRRHLRWDLHGLVHDQQGRAAGQPEPGRRDDGADPGPDRHGQRVGLADPDGFIVAYDWDLR